MTAPIAQPVCGLNLLPADVWRLQLLAQIGSVDLRRWLILADQQSTRRRFILPVWQGRDASAPDTGGAMTLQDLDR